MQLEINHYHHYPEHDHRLDVALKALERVEGAINLLRKEIATMSKELDALKQQVARMTEVEKGAVTLIQGLAGQIATLKDDPAALQSLADSLSSSADDLAAAVTANTPQQQGAVSPEGPSGIALSE